MIPSHVLTLLCRKPDLVGVIILLKDILSSADAAVKGAFADFTGEGANRQTSAKIEEWQRGLEDFKKRICTAARVLAVVVKNEPPSRERFYRCRNVLCRMVGQLIVLVGEVDGYIKRAVRVQPFEVEESLELEAEREFQEELARVLRPTTPRSQREDYRKEIGASQGKKTDSQIFHKEQIKRQTSALQNAVLKLSASDNNVNLRNNKNGVAIQYEERLEKLTVIHLLREEGANEKEEDGVLHLADKPKAEGKSLKKKKTKKNKRKIKKKRVKKEGEAGQERKRRNTKRSQGTDIEPMGLEEIPVQPHHDNDFSPPDNEAEPTSTKSPRPKQRRRPCLIA